MSRQFNEILAVGRRIETPGTGPLLRNFRHGDCFAEAFCGRALWIDPLLSNLPSGLLYQV